MQILKDGAAITAVTAGSTPVYVPGFEVTPLPPATTQGLHGNWLQIQSGGVDVGDANVAVLDLVGDAAVISATRGVGERAHVVTVRMAYVPVLADPLFADVILLMQRGVLVDTSSYARSVIQATVNLVVANVTQATFPSGKAIYINGAHNNRGIQYGMGAEMNLNTRARCFEAVVRLDVGAHAGGAQIFYNDGFGFGGSVWYAKVTDGNLGLRVDGPEIYAAVPFNVPENISYYVGCQIPTGPLSADNLPSFWAAPLTDATVTLRAAVAAVTRPVADVNQAPYTGYVGGSGGVNAYHIDMLRITNGVRYTPTQTIAVPTALWPEA